MLVLSLREVDISGDLETPYIQGVLNLKNKTETIPVQGGPLPYQL